MIEDIRILKNVKLGKNMVLGDFVIIGVPPRGREEGELETIIGDNAVIRSHTVIYAGNIIGSNFQTGHHVNIREENVIGDKVIERVAPDRIIKGNVSRYSDEGPLISVGIDGTRYKIDAR